MIELLTVIAIIAILSAIIFPVFARAKQSAARSSDISAMNTLRTALQLYRVDQGGYPPALLGFVTLYTQNNNVVPADKATGFLFPKRVDSVETFRPANNRVSPTITTTAVWPPKDPRAVGSAPTGDLNGDGAVNWADDPAGARQLFGPTDLVRKDPSGVSNTEAQQFYKISGYDVAEVPSGGRRVELRYALFWSQFALQGGNANDDARQLGYNDPPDSTVITWNSFFREYSGGSDVPARQKSDIVLFLGGSAKNYDSVEVAQRSWRVSAP